MTRTHLSRSKGQGHQAALLSAALTREAGAVVTWECIGHEKLLLRCVCSVAHEALGCQRGQRGGGISCCHVDSLLKIQTQPNEQILIASSSWTVQSFHSLLSSPSRLSHRYFIIFDEWWQPQTFTNGMKLPRIDQWCKPNQILKTKTKTAAYKTKAKTKTTRSKQRHLAELTFKKEKCCWSSL